MLEILCKIQYIYYIFVLKSKIFWISKYICLQTFGYGIRDSFNRKKQDSWFKQTDLNLNPLSHCVANGLTTLYISLLPCRVLITIVITSWGWGGGQYLGFNETSHRRNLTPSLGLVHARQRVLLFPSLSTEPRPSIMKIKTQKVEKRKKLILIKRRPRKQRPTR